MIARSLALGSLLVLTCSTSCTNDFEVFEGEYDEAGTASTTTPQTDGGSSADGGSSSGNPDPPIDAAISCTTSESCYTQAGTCNDNCTATQTTCRSNCPNGNQGKACRNQCDTQHATCATSCKTTCEQCAGPPCRHGCP